jgi:hypothetical protein
MMRGVQGHPEGASAEVSEAGFGIGMVLPELVGRHRWEIESTAGDARLLVWISRFRFVTAEAVAERFGVSVQRSRARLRRLERIGLLGSWRGHVSQAKAFWITGRGGQVIGQRRRRAPQPTQAREHEDAIVALATRYERDPRASGISVLTERECRARERRQTPDDPRYSVEIYGQTREDRKRWPDLVLELGDRRIAVEIEFSPKHTPRLKDIISGYELSSYERVDFYVVSPRLGARVMSLAMSEMSIGSAGRIGVVPWPGLEEASKLAVRQAVERARRLGS